MKKKPTGLIHPMNSPSSKKKLRQGSVPHSSENWSQWSPQNNQGMIGWSLRIFWVSWARNIWTRPRGMMIGPLARGKTMENVGGYCIGCFWMLWEMGHMTGGTMGGGCAHRIKWILLVDFNPFSDVTHEGQLWSWSAWTGAMSFSTKWYNWWLFIMDNYII